MAPRRILLIIMLTALAACAAGGMLALVVVRSETVWRLVGTAFVTAVTTGCLLPLTFLAEKPRFRAGSFTGAAVLLACWMLALVAMWSDSGYGGGLAWRAFALFWQTVLIGVPVTLTLMVITFREARVAVYTFIAMAALSYLLGTMGVLVPDGVAGDVQERLWGSGAAVGLLGLIIALLLVNLGCGDRRYFRWPGVLVAAAGLVLLLVNIWSSFRHEMPGRLAGATIAIAAAQAGMNVLLMARVKPSQDWVRLVSLACLQVAGFAVAGAFLLDQEMDWSPLLRIGTAAAIAAGSGSLATIVLAFLNRQKREPVSPTEFKEMTVICPGCTTQQAVPLGDATCRVCGLRIQIKLVEPQCPACGYLLYRMASDRCPECGTVIRPSPATGEGGAEPAGTGTVAAAPSAATLPGGSSAPAV